MARRKLTNKSRRRGMPKGFVSKAQWKFFFVKGRTSAKFRKLAHKEAHKTPGGKKVRYRRLPQHVRSRTRRRIV